MAKAKRYNGEDGSDVELGDGYGDSNAGMKEAYDAEQAKAEEPKVEAPKPKAKIVTKEELAKSGFTNLRDYLNDQQKLTRRDGKAPERVVAKKEEAAAKTEAKTETKAAPTEKVVARAGRAGQVAVKSGGPSMADRIALEAVQNRKKREAEAKEEASRPAPRRPYGQGPGLSALKGMKKGGMTSSSASRRADGIASKGKTRGKMC